MEREITTASSGVGWLDVRRVAASLRYRQRAAVENPVPLAQRVVHLIGLLPDHRIGACQRTVVGLQRLAALSPLIPAKRFCPIHPQLVGGQKAQCLYVLAEMRGWHLRVAPLCRQPFFHRIGGWFPIRYGQPFVCASSTETQRQTSGRIQEYWRRMYIMNPCQPNNRLLA